jgi:ATP-dependent Clp protease ATP-binding subunit ClpB
LLEGKFAPKDTIEVSVDPINAPGQFSFAKGAAAS